METNEHHEESEHRSSSRLQLINLLIIQIGELSRQWALLTASSNYNTDFSKREFSTFYASFLEVYKLTSTLISTNLNARIVRFIEECSRGNPQRETNKKGLGLATDLMDELQKMGLMQLFEEPVAPPFLSDFELEEYEEEQESKELVVKK